MKKALIIIFFPFQLYCQQWYSMGNLDTVGNVNGNKGVEKITFINNSLIVTGAFKYDGSTTINSIAHWGGTVWQPFGSGIWAPTVDSIGGGWCLAEFNNDLYCGGALNRAGGNASNLSSHYCGYITKWDNIDWYPIDGLYPPYSGFNCTTFALKTYHNKLFAGGCFDISMDLFGNHNTMGVAQWNDTTFSPLGLGVMAGDFPPHFDYIVVDLTVFQNKLIVGGEFTSIDSSPYGTYSGIAAWNDTAWSALGNGFNNTVMSLTVFNNELYAGGAFTTSRDGLTPLNHIAKWNGTNWQQVGDGLNDTVRALCVDSINNTLYAGGAFTQTGSGASARHIAMLNGSNWQEVGGGTNNDVFALFYNDSSIYVGGDFTRAGSIQASLIARWSPALTVGISQLSVENEELRIYPNPASKEIIIDVSAGSTTNGELIIKDVRIIDVLGQCVLHQQPTANNQQLTVDVSGLGSGVYVVETRTEKGVIRKKIIKQ